MGSLRVSQDRLQMLSAQSHSMKIPNTVLGQTNEFTCLNSIHLQDQDRCRIIEKNILRVRLDYSITLGEKERVSEGDREEKKLQRLHDERSGERMSAEQKRRVECRGEE